MLVNLNWPVSKLSGALWWQGEKRKDGLQLHLWNLNICIEKVDAKCWLAEMKLVMTSLSWARVLQCLFTFTFVSTLCWLAEIWQLSRQGATGELEVWFKFQRRNCKPSFLFPPCHQSASESLLTGQFRIITDVTHKSFTSSLVIGNHFCFSLNHQTYIITSHKSVQRDKCIKVQIYKREYKGEC